MVNKQLALRIADKLDSKKGEDILVLDVSQNTSYADYFIIVTGNSDKQIGALSDEVSELLYQEGVKLLNLEGKNTGWILLDYGDIIVHIFSKEQRAHYGLEKLWSDSTIIER
jgi:ribosome-associated protein